MAAIVVESAAIGAVESLELSSATSVDSLARVSSVARFDSVRLAAASVLPLFLPRLVWLASVPVSSWSPVLAESEPLFLP